ncbi:hypothetical protein EGI22_14485 [Lacihabitans sp. LS3-19]|uniref:hypothetical protein n=1 Tax=Lacihabitans sp. LS3-19 TaxID=2487335 RepID=UPI0020CE8E7A|nr:hypothetical protein [Lacihabitans sp. LS3-19]MCP9769123.1 hypothetical protein [Lacihabitans sp. LS3-19]
MTETQLKLIYHKTFQAKSLELRNISKELIEKARDKNTAYQIEFSIICISSMQYIQSRFTQKVLEISELNYKLGGNFKELVTSIIEAQDSFKREKEIYFNQFPRKENSVKLRFEKIFGIPNPFKPKIIFEGENNPYAWFWEAETEKREEEIARLYAEMRSTLYYYKRTFIRFKRLNKLEKATNKQKIALMNDILTTIQSHVPEITYFLGEGLAKGVFSAQGKDLWEKVKSWFSNDKEKAIVSSFEKMPEDVKQQGKLELLLEQKFEQLSEKDMLEFFELYLKAKSENPQIISYQNKIGDNSSNNTVIQGNNNSIQLK